MVRVGHAVAEHCALRARLDRMRTARPQWTALLLLIGGASSATSSLAADVAMTAHKHVGVASCAASTCHGRILVDEAEDKAKAMPPNVRLNEAYIWKKLDLHAIAYTRLKEKPARDIAARMGLPSALVKVCTDCHSDSVPKSQQTAKFQIDEGVGCEACHGGAEKWLPLHTDKDRSHARNVANGMYPLDLPLRRAELCVSCHIGTAERFVTHEMLGAGHPRLRFELEVFTVIQPQHFVEDEDYARRKGINDKANLWLAGQLASAERYASLLQGGRLQPGGMFPELAFYDCQGCHHGIKEDQPRWSTARAGAGIKPGTLRLQKHYFVTLQAAAEGMGQAAAAQELQALRQELLRAGQSDVAATKAAAAKLVAWIRARQGWSTQKFTKAQAAAMRRTLIRYAATDQASDYAVAEQMVFGAEALSYAIGDQKAREPSLKQLRDVVFKPDEFRPARFADVARKLQTQFQ